MHTAYFAHVGPGFHAMPVQADAGVGTVPAVV